MKQLATISAFVSREIKMQRAILLLLGFGLALAAVAVRGCTVPPELATLAKMGADVCVAETGAAANLIEDACHGTFAEDDKLKCYIMCILTQIGVVIDEDFDYEAMMMIVPKNMEERAHKAINKCKNPAGGDMCERAFNLAKCVYNEDPEDFFIP